MVKALDVSPGKRVRQVHADCQRKKTVVMLNLYGDHAARIRQRQERHPGEGRGPFLLANCRSVGKMDAETSSA
ncbi:hypothetical protein [Novosphingobium sp.]|uniref:hypothetical protein n=1 Tax=Novosphingobium sp. TaxID=1874826 RepID=UPI00261E1D37|nr:hypothetical protein [Novosphingobium sp.]